jgi:hypothetical protein
MFKEGLKDRFHCFRFDFEDLCKSLLWHVFIRMQSIEKTVS